jgi:hypothetical protein
VRGPVAVGVKLPVVDGVERETAAEVRLVRVRRTGALVLWMGMGPKSCVSGVSRRPVRGRPVPVRVKGEGVPEVVEDRVRVAVWGPAVEGVNWTPSQQLVQGPVKVEAKAEVGGAPWP